MNGLKHRLWGAIGLGVCVAFAAFGCQDGYPIAATPCDEWCRANDPWACYDYAPADCVASCEGMGYSAANCQDELSRATGCLDTTPHPDNYCDLLRSGRTSPPCANEFSALLVCVETTRNQLPPPEMPEAGVFE